MDTKFFLMGKIIGEEGGSGDKPDLVDLTATDNGTYRHVGHDGYDTVTVNVPKGITPTGNIDITTTSQTDVTNYATAQVVDSDLTASNIKKDVDILGVVGTYEAEADLEDITITQNGTYTHSGKDGYDEVVVAVPEPSGNINITDTNSTNVSAYATAQVVDSDLVAGNIKKDVNILGVVGTYEAGGSTPDIESLSISANGTYTATNCDGYSPITVAVPNSYVAGDEGKVVSNGALVSQSSTTKNANGTYDTTLNNQVVVNVANSYTSGDEGKVVNNGALVAQTSATKTSNGTYDTTLNNEIVVNVPQGITPTGNINITDMQSTNVTNYATAQVVDADLVAGNIKKDVNILGVTGTYEGAQPSLENVTITQNGTYTHTGYDGYDEVVVNVSGGSSSSNGIIVTQVDQYNNPVSVQVKGMPNNGYWTLYGWSTVVNVDVQINSTFLNDSVFSRMNSLRTVTIPSNVHELPTNCFSGSDLYSFTVPSQITSLGNYCFQNNQNLSSLTLNEGLESIGNSCLQRIAVTSLTIPSTVNSIGSFTVQNCPNLTTITFLGTPSGTIHGSAFKNCSSITDIYVPWGENDTANVNAPWGATSATIHYNWTPSN